MNLEIKSNLTLDTARDAINKLLELKPLLRTPDEDSKYCGKLPFNFFTASVFFELQDANAKNETVFRNLMIPGYVFPHFGSVILKGEGVDIDSTGRVEITVGDEEIPIMFESMYRAPLFGDVKLEDGKYYGAILMWHPSNFARFAFDVVALLNGTYRSGFMSSYYGLKF